SHCQTCLPSVSHLPTTTITTEIGRIRGRIHNTVQQTKYCSAISGSRYSVDEVDGFNRHHTTGGTLHMLYLCLRCSSRPASSRTSECAPQRTQHFGTTTSL